MTIVQHKKIAYIPNKTNTDFNLLFLCITALFDDGNKKELNIFDERVSTHTQKIILSEMHKSVYKSVNNKKILDGIKESRINVPTY